MIEVKKILFPVDFSDRCRGAAHAVRALARRFQAEVTALHVIERASDSGAPESPPDRSRQAMNTLTAGELFGCRVVPCITRGDPAVRIIEHAHNGRHDLIMMPTHGYGPFRRFLLGSVTAKVLHDAGCPVWTSAHLESWPAIEIVALRNVLCGVDFGPRSGAALKCASQVVAEFKAKLTVAHAILQFDTLAGDRGSKGWRGRTAKAAEERVWRMVKDLGVSAAVEILDGSPVSALSDAAERLDADLMVIGRTHAAADSGKLGVNAYGIIAHSPSPVLSV